MFYPKKSSDSHVHHSIGTAAKSIALSVVAATLFLGCGGGGGDSSSSTSTSTTLTGSYTVSVVDDNVIGAKVSAPECASFTDDGNGTYTLKECFTQPSLITAVGGFVDTDGDGVQGSGEASQTAPLLLKTSQTNATNSFTVTPLTTLASQESDLAALASALGVTTEDLFKDNASNRALMRAVNAVLISAREAGITKYEAFVGDFKTMLKAAGGSGLDKVQGARNYLAQNISTYQSKYGVVFGGFVDDTTSMDFTSATVLADVKAKNFVPAGKIRLGGFVYDGIIANASIKVYDGSTVIGTATSDAKGRYDLTLDESVLGTSKVLTLEATAGTIKLVSYITSDEIKKGLIGKKLSVGTNEDLLISNVTTAKAALIGKIAPAALSDAAQLVQAKFQIENLYGGDLLTVSAAIKDVVDNGRSISQTDTYAFANAIVSKDPTTQIVSITLPSNVSTTTTSGLVSSDALLSAQLSSTAIINPGSLKAILEAKSMYSFSYRSDYRNSNPFFYEEFKVNADGSTASKDYRNDGTSWIVYEQENSPSGSVKWSADGTTAYSVSGNWLPEKHTLIATELITIPGVGTIKAYIMSDEVTGEPSDTYLANIATHAYATGTFTFNSLSDATKVINLTYENGGTDTYTLTGTDHGLVNSQYQYRSIVRNGKTYLIQDDGQTYDGSGRIIYLDFAAHKAYLSDYHNIGFKSTSILFDNVALLALYKNMDASQRNSLQMLVDAAMQNQTFTATNTYNMIAERTLYTYIKSLGQ